MLMCLVVRLLPCAAASSAARLATRSATSSVYLNSILRDQKLKIYRSNLLPFLSSEGQLRDFDLLANFTDRKLWLPGMDGVNNWGRGADCWSVDHILAQKIQNGYKASLEDMMRMLEMTLTQFHLHDLWS